MPPIRESAPKLLLKALSWFSPGIRIGLQKGFNAWEYVDYIYKNQPSGFTPLGRYIDRRFLSHPATAALRTRRDNVVRHISQAIEHYDHPSIFDLAAGTGSYLFLLPLDAAAIQAGDINREAVQVGADRARDAQRHDITFRMSNALNPASFPAGPFDIIVTSGFFSFLPSDWIRKIIRHGSSITEPGARWVFNIQESYPELDGQRPVSLLERLMIAQFSGEARERSAEQVEGWASEFGWEIEHIDRTLHFVVATMLRKHISP